MVSLRDLRGPEDLNDISHAEARALCNEIRGEIIDTVAATGGHLGSSLGVIEMTVALHRILNSPTDRIVWDTGHQAYAHKLLTGRLDRFDTLRQLGGVGGFPRREESEHDVMDGGHAGTGISIGEGLALGAVQGRGIGRRVDASRQKSLHLVLHQRDQGRNHHRGARQQQGGKLIAE